MGDLRASSTNAAERDAYERMILDAQRAACFRYFEKWSFRVVQMKRLSKKVSVHLQRVQRQVMASRDFKIMWPGERIGALLKMWRRYTRFQKSVRNGRDTDEPPQMQWSDLPQLDAWDGKHILNSKKKTRMNKNFYFFLFLHQHFIFDFCFFSILFIFKDWIVEFEQLQIRAFKAASLGPMAVVRRMLHRMALHVVLCKDDRTKLAKANKHYEKIIMTKICAVSFKKSK